MLTDRLWAGCRAVFGVITHVLTILYPFIVSYILTHPDTTKPFAGVLMYLGAMKSIPNNKAQGQHTSSPLPVWVTRAMGASWFVIGLWVLLGGRAVGLQVYPLAVSACLLILFATTLTTKQSMIERFASLYEKNITPKKRAYMRHVTILWCAFFVVNIIISAITWLAMSTTVWVWYNGVISYVLMGALFIGEYAYRHCIFLKKP